jgi:aconitate hydratase
MGVLPLVFDAGQNSSSLGLDGTEVFAFSGLSEMAPRKTVQVRALKADGHEITFGTVCRLDTEVDVLYFEHGGILPYVLRQIMHF